MAISLNGIKEQLNEYWSNLESRQKRSMIIIISVVVIFIVVLSVILNRKDYVVLYSGLQESETAEVYTRLVELEADPQLEGTSTILVPKEREAELRMQLTTENYPQTGLNYDIFPNSGGFGQTDSEKKALMIYQLQQNLSSSIKFLDGVEDAIVLLAIPEDDSFVLKSQEVPVKASVIIQPKRGGEISSNQAVSIENLVAKSVPGLLEENITIIDSTSMKVLNSNTSEDHQSASDQFSLTQRLEDRIQNQVISLLEPVFGYGSIVSTVNVKLNFDKKTTESIRFEPVVDDSGIIVSQEMLKERVRNTNTQGVAGEDSNTTTYPEAEQGDTGSVDTDHEIINYEINQIKEVIEEQQGGIEDLSVSVIIDNESMDEQTLSQVQGLIATAIGTEQDRISVTSMPFDTSVQEELLEALNNPTPGRFLGLDKGTWMAIGLTTVFLVVMFLLVRQFRGDYSVDMENQLAADGVDSETMEETVAAISMDSPKQNAVKRQLDRFAAEQPDAVAQLLRNWLNDD